MTDAPYHRLPVPLSERNWGGWAAAAVAATAGVASWSFVVGGFSAYYVGAREGTATMIAGALIGQLLVTLSQIPPVTKYGIETLGTTKPQLGSRGAILALIVQYAILIGWNIVLIIFLGRACASALVAIGLIGEGTSASAAIITSLVATGLVWLLLQSGSSSLKIVSTIVAILIIAIGAWMYWLLLDTYKVSDILNASPIGPNEGGRLTNYATGIELLMVSTLGWWAYMGGMFRMVNGAGKGAVPSMVSLGFGWSAIGLIALYSGLVAGEADPTIWMAAVAGPVAGIFVLIFVALANLGSALVGAHCAALGFGELCPATRNLPWNAKVAAALVPMAIVIILFPGAFYDHIGTFMAFIGILVAPIIGIQIVDWFVLGRLKDMHVPSLYWHDARSRYWYVAGFNPAGFIAIACGGVTYILLLHPVTFVPNSDLFQYTTATLPAAFIGGIVYWVLMRGRPKN
ncbi:MAG: cytosine permease [Alphaproteobacteria bacterium]|nr:cytosine permease [Alphaproteobacteria bacterium]